MQTDTKLGHTLSVEIEEIKYISNKEFSTLLQKSNAIIAEF